MGTIFTFFRRASAVLAAALLLTQAATAQVSAYSFSQLSGTYTPITGGTVLGTTTSDDQRFVDPAVPAGGTGTTGVGLPIGFNFTFNGQVFDRFGINNNGWIGLGQSALTPAVNIASSDSYACISNTTNTTPAQLGNRIAGLSLDLQGQTGSVLRYETVGVAPNRVLVVQWLGYCRFGQTGMNLNFQIRLNETSNIVEVVYGAFTPIATNYLPQVGMRGQTNADFNNRSVVNGTNTWATSTAGATNNASCAFVNGFVPASGQIYRWTPPSCFAPAGLAVANIQPTTVDVNWATNIPSGQIVIVPQGNAPTTGTPIAVSGTTFNATGLTSGTAYSVYIRRICGVGDTSVWTTAVNFTPICTVPTGLANSNLQPTTADFAWTTNMAAGQMVIVPQGSAAATGTPFPITGTTHTATGLTPATNYSAYIRRICGVGDTSAWTAANNFTTACLPIVPPWTESFEGVTVAATGGPLPVCWARNTADFATGNGAQSQNRSARTGTKYLYTAWSSVAVTGDWAYTPAFTLTAGTSYDFSFWYKNDGLTGWDSMKVAIGTAQLPGSMIYIGSTIYNINNTAFQEYRVTVPVGVTGSYYFGVNVYVNGTPWYITFDDFNVEVAPSCPQPSAVTFSTITNNSATVNWTGLGAGNNFLYHFGNSPTAPNGAVGTPHTGTTLNLTGLTGNTAYQYYVRQICAVGDTSQWAGPFTFTTACDPITPGDTRAAAIPVTTTTYNTTGNTNSPCYTNTIGSASKDVWYMVVLNPCVSTITASLCTGTSYDSYLRVYADDGTTQLAFNDDGCGAQSVINSLNVSGRDTVYVLVEGFGSSVGAYTLQITQTVPVTLTADVSYAGTTQCVSPNSANLLPTNNGSTGGTFSAGAGLSIDSLSGEINLTNSTPNSYNIVYTVSDLTTSPNCIARDTFAMNIFPQDNATFSYTAPTYCYTPGLAVVNAPATAGGSFTSTPAFPTLVLNPTNGNVDILASSPGTYDVTYATTGTCPASHTTQINIVTAQNPAFNYSAPTYCQNVANPAATITGTTGGSFSAPAGLSINANTGLINLNQSTVGAYMVTYTTANVCAAAQSQSVEIVAADDASFTLNGTSFCQNLPTMQATVTGAPNGTFSSGTGMSVDIQFGLFNVNNVPVGTHNIIYATNGTCPNFSVQSFTVLPADNADISYTDNSFCLTLLTDNQTPTITGNSTGGTFSATGGLTLNATTGVVNTAVSANQAGTYTITYISNGPTTCPDTSTFTLTLEDCTTVGVVDFESQTVRQNAYNLYPNPAITQAFLHNKGAARIANIELVDMLGRSLHTWTQVALQEDAATSLELPSLPSATYYLRVVAPNEAPAVLPLRIQQP